MAISRRTKMKSDPVLYRRRLIPDELIRLDKDELLLCEGNKIVTKWNVLTDRHPFTHGFSCYYIDKNIKVSKFIDKNETTVYWYCDIIKTDYESESNTYTFTDLLADVIIYPDFTYKVVDLDEIADATEKNMLTKEMLTVLMRSLDSLLNDIYSGKFKKYTEYLDSFCEKNE